jgi:hypothetical protein
MMTIQQTVTVPSDRHLTLDLPETVPSGKVTLIISFVPAQKMSESNSDSLPTLDALKKQAAGKTAKRIAEGKKPFEGLSGCLKNSKTFEGNPVEIIRAMRDEW